MNKPLNISSTTDGFCQYASSERNKSGGAIGESGRLPAEDDVIAAARARVTAIEHELFRAESRLARFLVEPSLVRDEFVPGLLGC